MHVLLHVVDGFLSEIEVYRDDGGLIEELPFPAALRLFHY